MKLFRKKQEQTEEFRRQPVNPLRAERYRYHAQRDNDARARGTLPEKPRQTKASLAHRLTNALILIVTVGAVVYLLWVDVVPRVQTTDNSTHATLLQDESVYENGIADIIDNSVFNRSKLLVNTQKLSAEIKQAFPEIDEAVVTIPVASHRLVIDIRTKQPTFILNAQNGAFVIDAHGEALMRVGDATWKKDARLQTVTDESGIEVNAGERVITTEAVTFITGVLYQFEEAKQEVDSIVLPAAPNELRVTPKGAKYYIKFDMARQAREQAGSYFAVRDSLAQRGIDPAEYVDVRVAGKAYYK